MKQCFQCRHVNCWYVASHCTYDMNIFRTWHKPIAVYYWMSVTIVNRSTQCFTMKVIDRCSETYRIIFYKNVYLLEEDRRRKKDGFSKHKFGRCYLLLASSVNFVKSIPITRSSPTTQVLCPGGIEAASPGPSSSSVPSSNTTPILPEIMYWIWGGDWHASVFAIGFLQATSH